MPHLYLIRGVPGSGKTTFATRLVASGMADRHYEADMFMVDDSSNYCFQPERLSYVHGMCQNKTLVSLLRGYNVVVANTFTRMGELRPYIDMGFPYTVTRMEGNFQNVHGVPLNRVNAMRDRFEEFVGGSGSG